MNIKTQGYFKEMPHGNSACPSIKEYINKGDRTLIEKICNYLSSGVAIAATPGIVNDVIDPDKGVAGSPTALTDGTWVWPGDLAYYVKNYRLKIADEFIKTMQDNNWTIQLKLEDIDFDTLSIDDKSVFD